MTRRQSRRAMTRRGAAGRPARRPASTPDPSWERAPEPGFRRARCRRRKRIWCRRLRRRRKDESPRPCSEHSAILRQPGGADVKCVFNLERVMNAVLDPAMNSSRPSAASRAMIERLIGFNTVSRDSNLGLIEWVRDYLHGLGALTRMTHDATGKKANLLA